MSLTLILLPIRETASGGYSHEVLQVRGSRELMARIGDLPAFPVRHDFTCYVARLNEGEDEECTGYGDAQTDVYGAPLKYVLAYELQTTSIPGPVGAFVAALPGDTHVVLYWS